MGRLGTLGTVRHTTTKKAETAGQGHRSAEENGQRRPEGGLPLPKDPSSSWNFYLDPDTPTCAGPSHMPNSTPGWRCIPCLLEGEMSLCNPPVYPNSFIHTIPCFLQLPPPAAASLKGSQTPGSIVWWLPPLIPQQESAPSALQGP